MTFAERPSSTAWESVQLSGAPTVFLWVWYKPPAVPGGLCVQIPEESRRAVAPAQRLTMRRILESVGVAPGEVAAWSLYGSVYDGLQGANPALDSAIPPAPSGADPTITLYLHAAWAAPAVMSGPMLSGDLSADGLEALARMDVAWHASVQLEQQLGALAKQITGTMARMNSLNRDLSYDEFNAADTQEKREWNEARRWVREALARLSRFLKEHHVGMSSAVGKRSWFETIYKQYVATRQPFDGLDRVEREFDAYRKLLQTLFNSMNGAHSSAVQEGEQRAQQVLARITARVRSARTKTRR